MIKCSNRTYVTGQHSNHYLLSRYVANEENKEILMVRDTLTFLIQNLSFMINLKKSFLYPVKQIEFLGLILDTEKMSLVLSEKKNKAYVSTISGNFQATKNLF